MNRLTNSALALIECDIYGGVLCTWTYPGVSSDIQGLLTRCSTAEGSQAPFVYLKYKADWIYIFSQNMSKNIDPNVSTVSLCLVTRVFNPEKYEALLKILSYQYVSTGDPSRILEGYLSVFTTGAFTNSLGAFKASAFQDEDAIRVNCKARDIIGTFESDTVLLWNAVLLKKRILVYGDNITKVLDFTRTLPCFAIHRKDSSILRPIVRSELEHLSDLQSAGVYIAGTTDSSLLVRTDLFDVIASVPDRRITIAESATDDMRMGVLHRDILGIMIPADGSPLSLSDEDLIDAISQKTVVVVDRLQSLKQPTKAETEEVIGGLSKNEITSRWLNRLASAEGII